MGVKRGQCKRSANKTKKYCTAIPVSLFFSMRNIRQTPEEFFSLSFLCKSTLFEYILLLSAVLLSGDPSLAITCVLQRECALSSKRPLLPRDAIFHLCSLKKRSDRGGSRKLQKIKDSRVRKLKIARKFGELTGRRKTSRARLYLWERAAGTPP